VYIGWISIGRYIRLEYVGVIGYIVYIEMDMYSAWPGAERDG